MWDELILNNVLKKQTNSYGNLWPLFMRYFFHMS